VTDEQATNPAISLGSVPAHRNAVASSTALLTLGVGGFFLILWLVTGPESAAWVSARMKTNTAVCLVCCSLALLLGGRGWRSAIVSTSLATVALAIGAGVLFQYLTGINLHIDQLIARDFPDPETMGFPNRMAPNTALMFTLAGLALLLLPRRRRAWAIAGQSLALTMLGVCLLAAVGYMYRAPILYQPTQYLRMSPYVATVGALLAMGLVASRTDLGLARLMISSGPGGYLARRLLPLAGIAPILLGLLRLEGEKAGLYTTGTGTSLLVLVTMGTFLVMIAVLARTLDRVDVRRRRAEGELRRTGDLTAALARAGSVSDVVDVAVRSGLPALGAPRGSIMLLSSDGKTLRVVSSQGYAPDVLDEFRTLAVDRGLPVCDAIRTESPVFLSDREESLRRYPALAPLGTDTCSWAALPIQGRDRIIGAITLSFPERQPFDEPQRQRLLHLARQCGQALDRALLIDEREEARALLETLLSVAPVGWAYLDRDLRYVRVNEALATLHGLPAVEHVGRPLSEVLPPGYTRFIEGNLREVLATNQPKTGQPYTMAVDGDPEDLRHLLISFYPVPDREGLPVGIGKVVVDVTGEQRAREGAEAANRAKDEFMAMLGHELRNPLSPILTALQMMKLRGDQVHGKERAIIERQVRHLARLVDDLLDVSRITQGKIELHRDRVELSAIVAQAVEVASPLFEERVHRLFTDVPDDLSVLGDEHRLTQVLSNLLTNAAKYTPPGGRIDVIARAENGNAVITVKDTGKGIPPDLLSRVFDLFVQGYRTPERSGGGLGLGLSIVRMLVSMHGGQVSASSDGPGKGSAFTVTLPLDTGAGLVAAPASATVTMPTSNAGRRRVLVVDDNRDAAELLAEALQMEGYQTRVAFDGPSALRVAAEFRPELAFLDIGLPVMDGYDLARRLRALEQGPLVLVAVTGYGQPADRARSVEAGFDEHLVKPIGIDSALAIAEGTWKGAAAGSSAG
jgi:PAS domain S-box-containing protein